MKTTGAVIVGALGGAILGAALAWVFLKQSSTPESSGAAASSGVAERATNESLLRIEPDEALGMPVELAHRDPATGELERSLRERVEQLSAELAHCDSQLASVSEQLAFARENPSEDFYQRFKAMEMTQGLTDEEKTNVFVYVVKPLWETPQPEQLRPLADSIARYKSAMEKWRFEWLDDPYGPQGDSSHPGAQRLIDEHEAIRMRWLGELGDILGSHEKAMHLLAES